MRIAKDVTQADLAFEIGVSDGFISQVESPKSPSKYNLNHLNKIARYLNCSPRDFLPEKPL
ncbi:helix-turn-helix transcriptional regulator [uncultured Alistipes sp.]|uniref:helix-turn-helix domain-containing protein n=1 Tax=uncultured Alistipes sp. TaxID=538949 RepID=UPI0026199265|nr:helix-turn-helix transcriptional regulator [uncultured Alistipes sp.]